jgi:hypothetical protein
MKSLINYLLIVLLCLTQIGALAEETVLQGSVERTIPDGTPVKLKILTLPVSQESYLENWSLDGDFKPPKEGDKVTAEVTEPIFIQDDLVIPVHTKFFGFVTKVIPPARFGKNGRIELGFTGLETPSGKTLQFKESQNTFQEEQTRKQKILFGTARVGAYAAGGAAAGALVATQVIGLAAATLKPEYILTGGAAIGLLVGVVASIIKKGHEGRLSPGDEIQINLERSLVLPVTEAAPEKPKTNFIAQGLDFKINNSKLITDDFGKKVLIMNVSITNNSNFVLFTNDFALLGPYQKLIIPGGMGLLEYDNNPNEQSITMKKVRPGESIKGNLCFDIDFPGFEHILIASDRRTQTNLLQLSVGEPQSYTVKPKKALWKKKLFGGNSDPWESQQ